MVPMIRMFGFLLIILTIVFIVISVWSRNVRRNKLEAYWDERGLQGDRDDFIRRGLRQYDRSFRRKLIWLVYIVPITTIVGLVYVMNFM